MLPTAVLDSPHRIAGVENGLAVDLLIRNARTRGDAGALVDIAISSGRIQVIDERIATTAAREIDASGNLVTEAFVNPHLHLDKVFTLEMLGDERTLQAYHSDSMASAMNAIELAARVKASYHRGWILENVRRALRWALRYGTTHIRAFADVDTRAQLEAVSALIQAREEFRGIIDLQVVAFPQDGLIRDPGAANLLRQAMELGADVVGGIPWIESSEADAQRHIDIIYEIAEFYNKDVSALVDDAGDPNLRTLEMLAEKTIARRWHGRTLAHHARAMQLYPTPYFEKIAGLLKEARISIVSDPHTGPLHAPVKDLLRAGIPVCLGQDDVSDAYYPYGRNNMLEVAFLASHLLWMTTESDRRKLYDMVTCDAARAIGIEDFSVRVGAPAHLIVLGAETVLEALRHHEPPTHIISHGRLIDMTDPPESSGP